jgi:glycosyltransferase involved in cell wall biosynthesis
MKPRIAVVVHRWAPDIAGGAEALAWQYAGLLADEFDVELLTSTALDYVTWKSEIDEGLTRVGPISVRRFAPSAIRDEYFFALHRRVRIDWDPAAVPTQSARIAWTTALQEEIIKAQGPWCPGLLDHLGAHCDDYAAILLCTYLYPTSYFAAQRFPRHKLLLAPTLHDEAMAHLPVFARYVERIGRFIWLTEAERALARRLWNVEPGQVVGMAIDGRSVAADRSATPYLLYCGRIDAEKNCDQLLNWFARYRSARTDSALGLILTGNDAIGIGRREGVEFLGFVDEERKLALMAGALAFVQPSRNESFSIVALEAMAQGAPILVDGACEVLAEHVRNSGSGRTYHSFEQFEAAIDELLDADPASRDEQAHRGRAYASERYGRVAVQQRLVAEVRAAIAATPGGASAQASDISGD